MERLLWDSETKYQQWVSKGDHDQVLVKKLRVDYLSFDGGNHVFVPARF